MGPSPHPTMDNRKVQIGNDQEKAQSEKDSHSKNRGGKNQTNNFTEPRGIQAPFKSSGTQGHRPDDIPTRLLKEKKRYK